MKDLVVPLINAIKKEIPLLVRSAPDTGEHLEAVLGRQDLQRCYIMLSDALGPARKEFGERVTLDKSMQKLVDAVGGIRADQCLFLMRGESTAVAYATLWPWASDVSRVTLKIGVLDAKP